MRAWSLRVGLPKGVRPLAMHLWTKGWEGSMLEDDRRKERALSSEVRCCWKKEKISSLV